VNFLTDDVGEWKAPRGETVKFLRLPMLRLNVSQTLLAFCATQARLLQVFDAYA
jgi:hypothetical protein